jgi:hypothetical protein
VDGLPISPVGFGICMDINPEDFKVTVVTKTGRDTGVKNSLPLKMVIEIVCTI